MQIIQASIDLTRIDESKIKQHANGAKYYPISIIINDQKDQYGNDVAITTNQTKEERESGQKKTYIGNGKIVYTKAPEGGGEPTQGASSESSDTGNDLPF